MKHVETFKSFKINEDISSDISWINRSEVDDICKKLEITNYTIKPGDDGYYKVDVDGDVNISLKQLKKIGVQDGLRSLVNGSLVYIPIRFGKVSGDFNCSGNKLTSLYGAPKEVGEGYYCYSNRLTSLDGSPKEVGGQFNCSHNYLTSLEGGPSKVSVKYQHPKTVMYDCSHNRDLMSLKGLPIGINGEVEVGYCTQIKSLDGVKLGITGKLYGVLTMDLPAEVQNSIKLYQKIRDNIDWLGADFSNLGSK